MVLHGAKKRPVELLAGMATFGLGIWISLPPVSMATSAYAGLLMFASEAQWGGMFALVGFAHMIAVWVNGLRWWTPFSRSLMCAVSAMLYTMWVSGFYAVNPGSTAVFTYGALVALHVWCFRLATRDAAIIIGEKYAEYHA